MKSNASINWEPLDAEIKAWAQDGKSRNWIAAELCQRGLGCTRNAVIGRLWRLGVKSPHSASIRSTLGNITKRERRRDRSRETGTMQPKHKSLVANIYRERRERKQRWRDLIQKGAPEPLRVSAADLERFHCKSVVSGETGDRCEPLYCGHQIVDEGRPWCAYHKARYTRVERL